MTTQRARNPTKRKRDSSDDTQHKKHKQSKKPTEMIMAPSFTGEDEDYSAAATTTNGTREWDILHCDTKNTFQDSMCNTDFNVVMRTRSDPKDVKVPEKFYSSLKYEVSVDIPKSLFKNKSATRNSVFLTSMFVVDPDDHQIEVRKEGGLSMIDGISKHTTMNNRNEKLDVFMKIKFTDVSFHHEKRDMRIKMHIYNSSLSIETPILTILSPRFQIYARRPKNTTRRSTKQNTANVSPTTSPDVDQTFDPSTLDEPKKKKRKVKKESQKKTKTKKAKSTRTRDESDPLKSFSLMLGKLCEIRKRLPDQERQEADSIAIKQLELEPIKQTSLPSTSVEPTHDQDLFVSAGGTAMDMDRYDHGLTTYDEHDHVTGLFEGHLSGESSEFRFE